MNNRFCIYTSTIVLLLFLFTAVGCSRRSAVDEKMDLADSLMTSKPDSALAILNGVHASDVNGKETSAFYVKIQIILPLFL